MSDSRLKMRHHRSKGELHYDLARLQATVAAQAAQIHTLQYQVYGLQDDVADLKELLNRSK